MLKRGGDRFGRTDMLEMNVKRIREDMLELFRRLDECETLGFQVKAD